jgi:hypothetical protein
LKMANVSLISLAVLGPFLAIIFMNSAKSTLPLPASRQHMQTCTLACKHTQCEQEISNPCT